MRYFPYDLVDFVDMRIMHAWPGKSESYQRLVGDVDLMLPSWLRFDCSRSWLESSWLREGEGLLCRDLFSLRAGRDGWMELVWAGVDGC